MQPQGELKLKSVGQQLLEVTSLHITSTMILVYNVFFMQSTNIQITVSYLIKCVLNNFVSQFSSTAFLEEIITE